MSPLSSRHQSEPEALSKKPRPPPISIRSLCSTPMKQRPSCAFTLRLSSGMRGKELSGAYSLGPCGDSAPVKSTGGYPSVSPDRKISTKPLPGVR